jgi:metallo-beta-lactamase family protein
MTISFHGAARTVTGSKHLITLADGRQILMDCGMFQGMGKDTLSLNTHLGFNPSEIDVVILSHAHIDHTGLLPMLFAQDYKGKVFCTPPTAALSEVMLADSAHIQEMDVAFVNKKKQKRGEPLIQPLYTKEHVALAVDSFELVEYETPIQVLEGVTLTYTDTGHILGSAAIHLDIIENGQTKKVTFSGDVGRFNDAILDSPQAFRQADYILLESTYGNSLHQHFTGTKEFLFRHINITCEQKKGKLIIPAFSVGRTQELLYALNELEIEGRLPNIPVYVDSPLSTKVTEITRQFPHNYNDVAQALKKVDTDIFGFKGLKFITEKVDSQALNGLHTPCVIISASGMAEAGRIKHHIANNIHDPRNTILFVGYVSPNGLGGRLMAGDEQVKIFTDWYDVKAAVASMRSMSAHGDYEDLLEFLSCQNPKLVNQLFLVHGEQHVQEDFKARLGASGFKNVAIPNMHERFEL